MMRLKTMILASLLLGAGIAWAQEKSPAPAPMGDACAKHCQKGMGDHKAMMEKNAAAWKEIRAAVDAAKKAKGDRKIADLETALDRLVSFHESTMAGMSATPGMAGMDCGGGMGADHSMARGMDCCGDMRAMKHSPDGCGGQSAMADCCAREAHGMPDDCPMMKKGT